MGASEGRRRDANEGGSRVGTWERSHPPPSLYSRASPKTHSFTRDFAPSGSEPDEVAGGNVPTLFPPPCLPATGASAPGGRRRSVELVLVGRCICNYCLRR